MFRLDELQEREGKTTNRLAEEIGINRHTFTRIKNELQDIDLLTTYRIYKVHKKYGMTDKEFISLFKEEGEQLEARKNTRK
jgi:plasmid maintenance system antidote protein VapI